MDSWQYDPARDLNQPLVERLRRFPREPDMLVYGFRLFAAMLIRAWLRIYHRFRITGGENLPRDRPFVLVANHASHIDTVCMLAALRSADLHHAFPAAAKDYFFVSVPRVLVSAVIVNALPFDRKVEPRASLAMCRQMLEKESILLLFPEGTRSMTGELGAFKPGIGFILAGTTIPVVPCHLAGARKAWPKGAWLPRPRQIRLAIGLPRTYREYQADRESARHIAGDLREAVVGLSGQGND